MPHLRETALLNYSSLWQHNCSGCYCEGKLYFSSFFSCLRKTIGDSLTWERWSPPAVGWWWVAGVITFSRWKGTGSSPQWGSSEDTQSSEGMRLPEPLQAAQREAERWSHPISGHKPNRSFGSGLWSWLRERTGLWRTSCLGAGCSPLAGEPPSGLQIHSTQ